MGWIATVTNKGYALQAKLLSTDKLNITRVVSGTGSCATTQLINQTAITGIKQELTVDSLNYDKFGNARLKVTLNNINVTTSYGVSQIGIYATDPDEGEILYAIAQADEAEIVPSISEQPNGYYCSWDFSLTYSNAQNVNVTIDPSNAISQEEADKRYIQISKIGDNLSVSEDGTLSADAQQITVDAELNKESTNPIQNKVVYEAVKANAYTLPKASASTLGGVKVGSGLTVDSDGTLSATGTDVTIDSTLSSSSTNPVQNKVVNSALNGKVDKVSGKGLSSNDYTTTEKNKLSGIAEGANKYIHPSYTAKSSALYKVAVDSTGHISGATPVTKSDITDLGIPSKDTTYGEATTSAAGLMSATDKTKINGIEEGANKYTHPSYTAKSSGLYKVTVDSTGHVSGTTAVQKSDITALGIPGSDTTYSNATTSKSGLMSSTDKKKLDNIGVVPIGIRGYELNADGTYANASASGSLDSSGRISIASKSLNFVTRTSPVSGESNQCLYIEVKSALNPTSNTYGEVGARTDTHLTIGTRTNTSSSYPNRSLSVGYANNFDGYDATNQKGTAEDSMAVGHDLTVLKNQVVFGRYNNSYNSPSDSSNSDNDSMFSIGCGTSSNSKQNAFRVSSNGKCRGLQSFASSGADYAEYLEWEDGNPNNEDRRGRMVAYALTDVECTVEDVEILHPDTRKPITVKAIVYEKMPTIRYANSFDECIGVVSGSASFIGNTASEEWNVRFLRDVYGEKIMQAVLIPEKTKTYEVKEIDEKTGEEVIVEKTEVIPEHWATQFVLNPHYDPEKEYISREHRQEWDPIGMVGMVVVEDDGTCVVGGYCKPSTNGRGTAAETGYRVLQRIDNTHVRVLVR